MNNARRQNKQFRIVAMFATALVALSFALASPAFAGCTDSWTGGGGNNNWSNGANWSTGSEPGPNDSACIQSGAAVLMDVSDGIANLAVGHGNSLTLPTVPGTNNSLAIGGSSIANNGQIILPYQSSNQTGTILYITSGSNTTLSGKGSIVVSNGSAISGAGPGGTLVNQSTISGGGGILNGIVLNNTSSGVINANQSGNQFIVGRFTGAGTNTGLMEATGGGQLVIGSVDLNNVGGTIEAIGTGSSVTFAGEGAGGQTITGGTFTTSSGGMFYTLNSTTIDGTSGNTITNAGTLIIPAVGNNAGSSFQGAVNNTGSIQILANANGGVGLNIPGGQTFTLSGTGSLIMGDGTSNSYNNQNYISGSGTFANQQLIEGSGGIENLGSFNNSGTINDNVPTGTNNLQLLLGRAGASSNSGTIEATNGGGLVIGSTTINNTGGTIAASGTNSYVALVGSLGTSGLTISGGTYTTSDGGTVYGEGFTTLDGTTNPVTNAGTLIVPDVNQNTSGINAQGTLYNTGTIKLLSTGDLVFLQLTSSENLTLAGSGTLIMGDGTNNAYNNEPAIGADFGSNGVFTNQSNIEGSGQFYGAAGYVNKGLINGNVPVGTAGILLHICCEGSSGIVNQGTVAASNGAEVQFYPFTSFDNVGILIAAANSTINISNDRGPFLNLSNNTLTGGTYKVTGTLAIPGNIDTNAANITLNGPASQILNPNTNALAGFVTNAPKAGFTLSGKQSFTSAGTFTNQGSISIGRGSTFTVGSGGSYEQTGGKTTVNGKLTVSTSRERPGDSESENATGIVKIAKGSLYGNGGNVAAHVISSGTVIPAQSTTTVGVLKISGAYTQSSHGALDANIAGASAGQFNVLNVTGTATLGGTLNIGLLNNFVPAVGDSFEILTARQVNGTFATVTGTQINDSEHFTVTYNAGNVTLTVVSGP